MVKLQIHVRTVVSSTQSHSIDEKNLPVGKFLAPCCIYHYTIKLGTSKSLEINRSHVHDLAALGGVWPRAEESKISTI